MASILTFSVEEDQQLGKLVLPPELGSAVYIFRRMEQKNVSYHSDPRTSTTKAAIG
jgi:hypothetical protein